MNEKDIAKEWKWKEQTTHLTSLFKFISPSKEGICGSHFHSIYGLTVIRSLYMGIEGITARGRPNKRDPCTLFLSSVDFLNPVRINKEEWSRQR